jgi:hypothetical protein
MLKPQQLKEQILVSYLVNYILCQLALMAKGMRTAKHAVLAGCSAGIFIIMFILLLLLLLL